MRILLCEELSKYTNGRSEIQIKGDSLRDVLEGMFIQYPQFYAFMILNEGEEADRTSVTLNGVYLTDPECLLLQVSDKDVLVFGRDIPEGESGGWKAIAGAVIVVVGALLLQGNPYVISFGISLMVGGVAEMLMPTPSLPRPDGTSSSNTYSFEGIKNTTVSGTPIPLVYGRHRVGGHILNAYVDVAESSTDSFLYALLGLSEGEIENIDATSLKINGIDINSIADVTAYWRSGTRDQQPQPMLRAPVTGISDTSFVPPARSIPLRATRCATLDVTNAAAITCTFEPLLNVWMKSALAVLVLGADGKPLAEPAWCDFDVDGTPRKVKYDFNRSPVNEKITFQVISNRVLDAMRTLPLEVVLQQYPGYVDGGIFGATRPADSDYGWVSQYTIHDPTYTTSDSTPAITGFNRIRNSNTYDIKIPLLNPLLTEEEQVDIGARFTTTTPVHKIQYLISAPVLFTADGKGPGAADFNTYIKPLQGDHSWVLVETGHISGGPSKSEINRSFEIDFSRYFSVPDYFEVKIVKQRLAGDVRPDKLEQLRLDEEIAASMSRADDIYLKAATEITEKTLIYPHVALLGYRIKATEQIQGSMPTLTAIVNGIKVAVPTGYVSYWLEGSARSIRYQRDDWDGTLSYNEANKTGIKYWTDSPVWILYDLLTNPRYGLGDYFRILESKRPLILANFINMSAYADQYLWPDGSAANWDDEPRTINGQTVYPRPRFSLNLVVDESKTAREWVNIVCASMRATLFLCEGMVFLDIDRDKPISKIFNVTNLKDYVQSTGSYRSIPNTFEVQFPNKAKNYEMDSFVMETKELRENQALEEIKTNLSFIGVTEEIYARRLTAYALAVSQLMLTTVTFKTGTNALAATVTDIIGIQHDVSLYGVGGRIVAVEPVPGGSRVTLSEPFRYTSRDVFDGTTGGLLYDEATGRFIITGAAGSGGGSPIDPNDGSIWGDLSLVAAYEGGVNPIAFEVSPPQTGTHSEVIVLHAQGSTPPKVGEPYILNQTVSTVAKPFKILNLKRDGNEFVEVTAVEYNAEIYNDDISTLGEIVMPDYSILPVVQKQSVLNFRVDEKISQDTASNVKVGVDIWYSLPVSSVLWKGLTVAYALVGSSDYTFTPLDASGHIEIPDIPVAGEYLFVGVSVFKDGTQQSVAECLNDKLRLPYAFHTVTPYVKNDSFMEGVRDLRVANSLNNDGETFTGKDCVIQWRSPVIVDQFLNNVAGNLAPGNSTDSWLGYYLVEVKNPDGSLRRSAMVSTTGYRYSHEMNHDDGRPARTFDVTVTTYDRLGRMSKPVTVTATNPVPEALQNIRVVRGVKNFSVAFAPSRELDIAGYVIHAVPQAMLDIGGKDFTPSASNPVYNNGAESSFYAAVEIPGSWYVKVAAYDSFEDLDNINYASLNYNSPIPVSVIDDGIQLPIEFYDELRTDFIIKDIRFYFGDSPANTATAAILRWDAGALASDGFPTGRILRGDKVYTLSAAKGNISAANGCYVLATLDNTTRKATFSIQKITSSVPVLKETKDAAGNVLTTQIIIAVTSSYPPVGGINNICYVRQSNSMEMEGALIRNLTVTGNQVVGGTLTVTGNSTIDGVAASTVASGANAAIAWRKPGYTLIDGNKIFTGDAYVNTLQIKGQAVTVPYSAMSDTSHTGWVTRLNLLDFPYETEDDPATPILVTVLIHSHQVCPVRLERVTNGTTTVLWTGLTAPTPVSDGVGITVDQVIDTPPAGVHTHRYILAAFAEPYSPWTVGGETFVRITKSMVTVLGLRR